MELGFHMRDYIPFLLEDLSMRKLSACWVPSHLSDSLLEALQSDLACILAYLKILEVDPQVTFHRNLTMDETLVRYLWDHNTV